MPRKNLRTIRGRTLVALAVHAAIGASTVTRVVGSTDDDDIAEELRRAGAEVPALRPTALAADDVRDGPVFIHVLDALAATGYEPDIVVNVRPTAPLRGAKEIDGAVACLLAHPEARSVKCVVETERHPYKMWTLGDDGILEPLLPGWRHEFGDDPDVPRQYLPKVYRSSAAVDAVWTEALRESGHFHPGPVVAFVLDAARDVDVDTEDDLILAESLLEEDGES